MTGEQCGNCKHWFHVDCDDGYCLYGKTGYNASYDSTVKADWHCDNWQEK